MARFHRSAQDVGNGDYKAIIDKFEKTRKFGIVTESQGIMSERGEHYAFPDNSPADLAKIKEDRDFLKGLTFQPKDEFKITQKGELLEETRSNQARKKHDWLPFKYKLYRIDRNKINKIAKEVLAGRLLRMASIHGATHSVAELITILDEKIPFDFCYYSNIPTEQDGELEYVLYYTQEILKVPLVMGVPQNTAMEYYYQVGRYPTQFARWCTDRMKLEPIRRFFNMFFLSNVEPGNHIDILQFLGMQAFQSAGRASLDPKPTPSMLSVPQPYQRVPYPSCQVYDTGQNIGGLKKYQVINWPVYEDTGILIPMNEWHKREPELSIMRVFDTLPVFYLSHEDDLDLLESVCAIRNPNEREFGRHGCVLCPFADWRYYHQIRTNYKKLYKYITIVKNEASRAQIEKEKMKKPWTQYGTANFREAIGEAGYEAIRLIGGNDLKVFLNLNGYFAEKDKDTNEIFGYVDYWLADEIIEKINNAGIKVKKGERVFRKYTKDEPPF